MPIAASVASHNWSGLRSPFAAKAMMRFAIKRHAQHRDRVGIKRRMPQRAMPGSAASFTSDNHSSPK
jgi:hypothetical protein